MNASAQVLREVDIKRLLAHREPFLLVHHAIENIIGKRVTTVSRQGIANVRPNSLQILEGLGQTSALLLRQVRISFSFCKQRPQLLAIY